MLKSKIANQPVSGSMQAYLVNDRLTLVDDPAFFNASGRVFVDILHNARSGLLYSPGDGSLFSSQVLSATTLYWRHVYTNNRRQKNASN